MEIKKYVQFITEATDSVKDDSTFDKMKDAIRSMIEETIKKSGGTDVKNFASKYVDGKNISIEGLINDDQIYDFWLEYQNEIDELLNQIKFFNDSPISITNPVGIYKYIIEATKRAILEIVRLLK